MGRNNLECFESGSGRPYQVCEVTEPWSRRAECPSRSLAIWLAELTACASM